MNSEDRQLTLRGIYNDLLVELGRAEEKWPSWHPDPIRQAATVAEEAGEVLQAALNLVQKQESYLSSDGRATGATALLDNKIDDELIQTGAMVFRMLLNRRLSNAS